MYLPCTPALLVDLLSLAEVCWQVHLRSCLDLALGFTCLVHLVDLTSVAKAAGWVDLRSHLDLALRSTYQLHLGS